MKRWSWRPSSHSGRGGNSGRKNVHPVSAWAAHPLLPTRTVHSPQSTVHLHLPNAPPSATARLPNPQPTTHNPLQNAPPLSRSLCAPELPSPLSLLSPSFVLPPPLTSRAAHQPVRPPTMPTSTLARRIRNACATVPYQTIEIAGLPPAHLARRTHRACLACLFRALFARHTGAVPGEPTNCHSPSCHPGRLSSPNSQSAPNDGAITSSVASTAANERALC